MRILFSIAYVTFLELARSRMIIGAFLLALLLQGISSLLGSVTLGDSLMVVKSVGLMSISLGSIAFVIISGAALLERELKLKTVMNVLSKPISRGQFIFGKWLGMWASSLILVTVMGGVLIVWVGLLEGGVSRALLEPLLMNVFELGIVSALAIFFSSIVVTPALAGFFTGFFWLAGRSLLYIEKFADGFSGASKSIIDLVALVLPKLYLFPLSEVALYGAYRSKESILLLSAYTIFYSLVLVFLGSIIFRRRNIQ